MVDILIIFWILGVTGGAVATIGSIFLSKGIKNLTIDYETKKAITYMFLTGNVVIIYAMIVLLFWIFQVEMTIKWWVAIPLIYIITKIFWFMGAYKLMEIVKEVEKNE